MDARGTDASEARVEGLVKVIEFSQIVMSTFFRMGEVVDIEWRVYMGFPSPVTGVGDIRGLLDDSGSFSVPSSLGRLFSKEFEVQFIPLRRFLVVNCFSNQSP